MPKPKNMSEAIKANSLYQRAEEEWQRGHQKSAFRLFHAAAQASMDPAFRIVAQFYHFGRGVKTNERLALYWYRRAYRTGSDSAANNIGVIWRDKGKISRSLLWFRRAVRLGDGDANLEIAKIYLSIKLDLRKAVHYLDKASKAKFITEGSKEQARHLLKEVRKKLPRRTRAARMNS